MEFLEKLDAALAQRREYLDAKVLPHLRDNFHGYQAALKSIISVLEQKSLLRSDPYKHEQRISEISLPPNDPIMDAEKIDQLSIRLSDFENQLDFLNNFYQFSVEFLNLDRVRLLSKLVHYITWEKLSDLAGSINTRVISELITKIRLGHDKLSIGLLSDAQGQILKAMNEILDGLRDLTSFHREQYKLEMRRRLFEGSPVDANEAVQNREESVRKLKLRFAHLQSQGDGFHVSGFEGTPPYYPELINEILDEDFSEYAENLQQGVLDKLAVREAEQEQKPLPPLKPLLLEGVRLLSVASAPLEAALQKLAENGGLLTERKVTFGERIRRWFTGHAGSKEEQTYDIEITDPTTAIMSTEKLDFKAYSQRALRRCRILASLSNRMTESYTKIEELDEVKLDEFLAAGIDDVHYVFTRMPPLETYFKSELSRDERVKLKGIKLELNAIKNALVKANQKRHEYVSRREEREQLKRLGIDAER